MQLGFNENIVHNGQVYHIQTEDGGISNPVITTLLYQGGTILASKRTNYSDIIKFDKLDAVVKDIMMEQHGTMLKNLKDGVFGRGQPEDVEASRDVQYIKEKKDAPLVSSEKGLDDIILEYLSMSEDE